MNLSSGVVKVCVATPFEIVTGPISVTLPNGSTAYRFSAVASAGRPDRSSAMAVPSALRIILARPCAVANVVPGVKSTTTSLPVGYCMTVHVPSGFWTACVVVCVVTVVVGCCGGVSCAKDTAARPSTIAQQPARLSKRLLITVFPPSGEWSPRVRLLVVCRRQNKGRGNVHAAGVKFQSGKDLARRGRRGGALARSDTIQACIATRPTVEGKRQKRKTAESAALISR